MSLLRDKLLELAQICGVGREQYPRSTDEGGRKALARWRERLFDSHGRGMTAGEFGTNAANNFDDGWEAWEPDMDPHRIVTFDEYTPDVFTCIQVPKANGSPEWKVLSRYKVISGKRRGSRDICVCRQVLRKEPDVGSFLDAIESAVRPHQRLKKFEIEGLQYPSEPCFASELPGGAWLLFDLIFLDRSRVHLARETRLTLTKDLGSILVYGVARRPKARADIEAWHSVLSSTLKQLPMTTGGYPGDPKRRTPEMAAIKYRFQPHHVAEILESSAARSAVARLKSLRGHTPMEELSRWALDERTILRHLPPSKQADFSLATTRVQVRIWCDRRSGRQPVVKYLGAEYIGPQLARMRSKGGKRCILTLHNNAAHFGRLFDLDGKTEIDVVYARGEWKIPHRLHDRVLYRKRMRRRAIAADGTDGNVLLTIKTHFERAKMLNKDEVLQYAEFVDAHPISPHTTTAAAIDTPVDDEDVSDGLSNTLSAAGDW